jgi:2-polyprenyl-6-methoxyphenol hydroxylase-like FAD-dependent oxidoreductase
MREVSLIYDVVIAGAGPVGLFLACELRLAGCSVLVLEQAKDPRSPLKGLPLGLRGLWGPSVEAFYRRGLLDDLASQSSKQVWGSGVSTGEKAESRRPAGHFAGIFFYADKVDFSRWRYRLTGPAAIPMPSDMQHIESVLTVRANAMGVEIRRGFGVEGFEQSDEEVTVRAGEETILGRWLIGCDGGRSTVRKAGGFEFVGTDPEFTGYSLQVEMADPDKLPFGRHYTPTGMYSQTQPGFVTLVDFDGGAFHRTQPITLEHAQAVLRRISCVDVTLTALKLATTWTDRAYQATTYRRKRILLAGDAAHIHSPLGGQGLNLGFGDAMNLGWKLAATLRGDAPAGLLDTYSSERHPIGAKVLDWSRAQVALMRPSPVSRALEAIVRDLIDTRDGATYFAERVWGVSIRYNLADNHPLVGRSAPDFELTNRTRLGELLRNGRGLLLDFEGSSSLRALASRWSNRFTYVASDAKDRVGLNAVLVRPDGFVAWASDGAPDSEEVAQAAVRWFGEPASQGGRPTV